jgi:hypothetical protein
MMLRLTMRNMLFGENFDVPSNSVPCPTDVPIRVATSVIWDISHHMSYPVFHAKIMHPI